MGGRQTGRSPRFGLQLCHAAVDGEVRFRVHIVDATVRFSVQGLGFVRSGRVDDDNGRRSGG